MHLTNSPEFLKADRYTKPVPGDWRAAVTDWDAIRAAADEALSHAFAESVSDDLKQDIASWGDGDLRLVITKDYMVAMDLKYPGDLRKRANAVRAYIEWLRVPPDGRAGSPPIL